MSSTPKSPQEINVLSHLRAMNAALTKRVEELEAKVESREETIRDLECELAAARLSTPPEAA